MQKISKNNIVWENVKILKDDWKVHDSPYAYEFILPKPLSEWDVYDYWEKPRFESMRDNIKNGDVLFDIGTEQGWTNLIYADFCGPENIVLIEPTKEFWGNIKFTWEKNYNVEPKATLCALLSDKTTPGYTPSASKVWCEEAEVGWIIDRNKYQYIHENSEMIPEVTLDDYVEKTGIVPDALTCDTEGSELLILKGAIKTLSKHKPKLFISVHPDMALRDYGIKENELDEYLKSLGYKGEFLAKDHEIHMYYENR